MYGNFVGVCMGLAGGCLARQHVSAPEYDIPDDI